MQILRTIFWVLVVVALALFTIANWQPVEVRIWEGLLLETRLPAIVIGAFLIGLVPMWLLYRATRWRLGRKIATLETSLAAYTPAPPLATSTQLDAAATRTETP
jgi:uncharacterized integral membrane protein